MMKTNGIHIDLAGKYRISSKMNQEYLKFSLFVRDRCVIKITQNWIAFRKNCTSNLLNHKIIWKQEIPFVGLRFFAAC